MSNSAAAPDRLTAKFVHEMFDSWDEAVPSVEELRQYFTDDIVYQDPLQKVVGIHDYWDMNVRLLDKTAFIQIEMLESAQTGNTILFTYRMALQPSARAPRMNVEGATHVQLNDEGKIYLHRDYYDFATTFTEAIPLLRGPYRWFKSKLVV